MNPALLALIPQIPSLILSIENLWKNKPKSGTDKTNAALQTATTLLNQLESSGVLPAGSASTVTANELLAAIQGVFTTLQTSGAIPPSTSAPAPTPISLPPASVPAPLPPGLNIPPGQVAPFPVGQSQQTSNSNAWFPNGPFTLTGTFTFNPGVTFAG